MSDATQAEQMRFKHYHDRIVGFVEKYLCGPIENIETDFIGGTQPIDFYEDYNTDESIQIEDLQEEPEAYGGFSYEEALFNRLHVPIPSNLLIIVGGLGSGKSTAMRYLRHLFTKRREEVDNAFPCPCRPCKRIPIYLNFDKLIIEFPSRSPISQIFRGIRSNLCERLIDEWLSAKGIAADAVQDFDAGFKVLRRLMIVNDLQKWALRNHAGDFPVQLEIPELTTEPIFTRKYVTLENLHALVASFEKGSARVDNAIETLAEQMSFEVDFSSLLLKFYASRCRPDKPSSALIIDNLDHQPTEIIETVIEQLARFCRSGPIPPVILPLRPSSLGTKANDGILSYLHHYSPNCFELVLQRLQKYVLGRSMASLSGTSPEDKLPCPFPARPTQDELYAFLFATYLYAKIMTAGLGPEAARLTNGVEKLPKLHTDFASTLESLPISEGAMTGLSETIDALVGTCARYAVTQLRGYYQTIYRRTDMLTGILRGGITRGATPKVPLGYSQIIKAVLAHARPGEEERIANLYKPTELGAHKDYPSLAKLRVLMELDDQKRMLVDQLLRHLTLYGIPFEVGISTLNYLHRKERLLVWFSKNSDLKGGEDLQQYVTISEHGRSYLRHVIGDFEYIWFCAGEIPPRSQQDVGANFRTRLQEYTRLIQDLSHTEWKQLAFVRCIRAEEDRENRSAIKSGQMLTLRILYASLERAMTGSRFSLRISKPSDDYRLDIAGLVARVCSLILELQQKYRICYGDSAYPEIYKRLREKARPALQKIQHADVLADEEVLIVRELLQSWDEQQHSDLKAARDLERVLPPEDNDLAPWQKLARGQVPGIDKFLAVSCAGEVSSPDIDHFWHFLRYREELTHALENRLPEFSSVERGLHHSLEYARRAIVVARSPAKQSVTLRWLNGEIAWMKEQLEELRQNVIRPGELGSYQQMDEAKDKFNSLMRIFEGLARRWGAKTTEHLGAQWY